METVIAPNPPHVLMPSTTELEDADVKNVGRWKPSDCFVCGGKGSYVGFVRGSTTEVDTYACSCEEQLVLYRWFAVRGLPKTGMQLRWPDMSGVYPEWRAAMDAYFAKYEGNLRAGQGALLHGRSGSGKSSLAWLMMKALLYQDVDCFAFNASLTADRLFMWRNDQDRLDRWQRRVQHSSFLVIDDLGSEVGGSTDMVNRHIERILTLRSADCLSTFITTNYSLDELSVRYSPAVMETLRSTGGFIEMNLPESWRDTVERKGRVSFEVDHNISRPAVWS